MVLLATEVRCGTCPVPEKQVSEENSLVSPMNIHFRATVLGTCNFQWLLPTHAAARADHSWCPRTAAAWCHADWCARALSARMNGCCAAQLAVDTCIEPLRYSETSVEMTMSFYGLNSRQTPKIVQPAQKIRVPSLKVTPHCMQPSALRTSISTTGADLPSIITRVG